MAKKLKKQLAGPTKDYVELEGTHAVLAICMALLKDHAGAITDLELQLSIPTLGEIPIAPSCTNLSVQGSPFRLTVEAINRQAPLID